MRRSARILGVPIDDAAAAEIARRSRGHAAHRQPAAAPRARLRAGARRRHASPPTSPTPALKLLEVDEHGFDEVDRKLLRTIIDKFGGGPVGRQQHRRGHQRGEGRHRGHLRAVPDSDRLSRSHAARPRGDGARLRLLRADAPGKGFTTVVTQQGSTSRTALRRTADDDPVAGDLRAAARADQRRSREDGRHDRRVDPAAHRHPRAAHRRSGRRHVGSRQGSRASQALATRGPHAGRHRLHRRRHGRRRT